MNLRIVVVALSLALSVPTASQAFEFRTVALTGEPAHETPAGVQFSDFIHAVINQSGDVAFNAVVAGPGVTPGAFGNSTGIWVTGGNGVRKVVRSGDQAAGVSVGGVYQGQSRARIDDQGGVAFLASGLGLYSEGSGPLSLVLPLPVSSSSPAYSGSGKLAVRGRVTESSRVDSIWTDASGSMVQVLKTGDAAPGIPGYSIADLFPPVINDAKVVVFTGTIETQPFQLRTAMWQLENGVVSPLVQTGQAVPGFAAGTVFNGVSNGESVPDVGPKINNVGQVLFQAGISGPTGNSTGLWLHDQGDVSLVAQRGSQAPGMNSGVNFNSFDVTRINAAGAVTLYGSLTGPGVTPENSGAIWTQRNGALALVAREGEHPPGVAGGLAFSSLQQLNPDLTVNANGQIAFRAGMSGNGVTFENDRGVWATDLTGALKLIVREGELFDVNSDPQLADFRTISEAALAINGSGGEDGAYASFNDAGELAVTLNFTDGSAGVFVFNTAVPEPSSILIVGLAAVLFPLARKRRFTWNNSTGNSSGSARCKQRSSLMNLKIVVAALSAALYAPAAAQSFEFRTIALSGQQAPGEPDGVLFSSIREGVINEDGVVAFDATVAGPGIVGPHPSNAYGLWKHEAGIVTNVVRSGAQAVGLPAGVNYYLPGPVRIDSQGRVAFSADTPGESTAAVYSEGLGALRLVARETNQVPGLAPGVNFNVFSLVPLMNRAGNVAFTSFISGPGLPSFTEALFADRSGTLELLIKEGDPAPAGLGGSLVQLNPPVLNDHGLIAFSGRYGGGSTSAVWTEQAGAFSVVARTGETPAGMPAGVTFNAVSSPRINNAGQVAFDATLAGAGVTPADDRALWKKSGVDLQLIAREGQPAVGVSPGLNHGEFIRHYLNGVGEATFTGKVVGAGVTAQNDTALWSQRGNILTLIAREGDPAPGTPAGVAFGDFTSLGGSLGFQVNNNSQVAFEVTLTGPAVTTANDKGIWVTDLSGALTLVTREGDLFDVNDDPNIEDLRTVQFTQLEWYSGGGEDGYGSSFNSSGELAIALQFTDPTSGGFVIDTAVPEPSTLLLVGCAAAALSFARRRRLSPRSMTGG